MNDLVAISVIVMMVAALGLVVLGLRQSRSQIVIEERLAQFGHRVPSLEELELQQPFRDRILIPMLRRAARTFGRFTPKQNNDRLRQKLMEAGLSSSLGPTEFLGLRIVLGGVLGGLLFLIFLLGNGSPLSKVLLPISVAVIGYLLPGIWLGRKISQRKTEIIRALPDAIDLLTISVEAGLGFDPALARVVDKWDNALTREFGRMLSELRMGSSRRDAMRDLAKRVNVDDLTVFVSAIVQADQLGVSITQVLRVQSKQMRMRRRQRAEEKAQKAPIKLLFPMVFFIFPALYVVLLGPAIPSLVNSLR